MLYLLVAYVIFYNMHNYRILQINCIQGKEKFENKTIVFLTFVNTFKMKTVNKFI